MNHPTSTAAAPMAWIVTPSDPLGPPDCRIFGLTGSERLERCLAAAGCRDIRVVSAGSAPQARGIGQLVLCRSDAIFDVRLIDALARSPDTLLVSESGSPVAACVPVASARETLAALASGSPAPGTEGVRVRTADELVSPYDAKLRKREPSYLFERCEPGDVLAVEARVFQGSYKGLTDLVTRWVWPAPALAVVRRLARHRVHPNSVTALSYVLTLFAFFTFARGAFGVGLLAAWTMTFLDTVDGKLARCTLTSSRLGNVLDHGLDLVHPPFWWYAWGLGLAGSEPVATTIAVVGYVAGRVLEGGFLAAFGFESHSWRALDGLFRTITARRNPNLILLSVGSLARRPDLGFIMVALWTVVSLLFHSVRFCQALRARARGEDVRPWDEATDPALRPTPAQAR